MKVSIIVPIYNVEKYIKRCVDSIVGQTYYNLEIILVDDGSKDNCGVIIDEYAKNDERILVIHKKNGGLSSARNNGLKLAKGDYILFVDGDDYIDKYCVEKLISVIESDTDIVLFPYIREYSDKKIQTHLFQDDYIKFDTEQVQEVLFSRLIGPDEYMDKHNPVIMDRLNTAWGKLYNAKLIREIEFVDTKEIGTEDGWFNILAFEKVTGSIIYTEITWYHYEKSNTNSLLHTYREAYVDKRWNLYNRIHALINGKDGKNLEYNLNSRIVLELFGIVLNINAANLSIGESAKTLKEVIVEKDYDKFLCKYDLKKLDYIWKIFYSLCKKRCYYIIMCTIRILTKVGRNQ